MEYGDGTCNAMGAVVIYALEQVTGRCFSRSPRSLIPDNLNCRQCSEPSPNILDSMSLSALQACFIAVHAGAGYHGTSKEHTYRAAMQQALQAAAQCLDAGGSSMDAVRSAICVLEVGPPSIKAISTARKRLRMIPCSHFVPDL